MATISRGTIKAYDAGTHRATVQVVGSLAVWLDAIPVSDALEPPEVVVGRECGVLFFTDDNPNDAAVISVHNATPLGTNRLRDADADTRVEVERTADEDKIALTVQGTLRYLAQYSTPHHQFTGDVLLTGHVAAGTASVATSAVLALGDATAGASNLDGLTAAIVGQSGTTAALRGVTGEVQVQAGASTMAYARGLEFKVTHVGTGTITDLLGCQVVVDGTGPSTNRVGFWAEVDSLDTTATLRAGYVAKLAPSVSTTYANWRSYLSRGAIARSTITDFYHYAAENLSTSLGGAVTTVYGYYIPNMTVGSNKLPFYDGGIGGNKNDTSGNRFRSNTQFGATAGQFGTGDGVVSFAPAATNPSTNPATGVIVYVDAADGKLKARGSAGTITVLAIP